MTILPFNGSAVRTVKKIRYLFPVVEGVRPQGLWKGPRSLKRKKKEVSCSQECKGCVGLGEVPAGGG